MRIDLAIFRELEAFAKFGSDLDKATQQQLERGYRLVELLKQNQYAPLPVEQQVAIIFLGVNGYLDKVPAANVISSEMEFHRYMTSRNNDLLQEIKNKKELDENLTARLHSVCKEFIETCLI